MVNAAVVCLALSTVINEDKALVCTGIMDEKLMFQTTKTNKTTMWVAG
jgi:hypothetical protein